MAVPEQGSRDEEWARRGSARCGGTGGRARHGRSPRRPVTGLPEQEPAPPPGLLRLFVVFHEPEALGAGRSVLGALEALAAYGWTTSAWVPGDGPLLAEGRPLLASVAMREKPLRYSLRGWRADPGAAQRLRATPAYLREMRRALLIARPHVVHVNTLRSLPEARVARALGLPVVL